VHVRADVPILLSLFLFCIRAHTASRLSGGYITSPLQILLNANFILCYLLTNQQERLRELQSHWYSAFASMSSFLIDSTYVNGSQVGHPFDTIKVRMQMGRFPKATDAIKATIRKEGVRLHP